VRVVIRRAPDGKITLQETAKIAIVTINRPAARNALTTNMWRELAAIGREIRPKNKIVILRGTAGNFTAGADIKEFCEMSAAEANDAFEQMEQAISIFENLPIPVICAVDGPAMGAGLILSLAGDMRVGSPLARMGIPVGRLGITVGPAFMRRIVRLIGPSRAKELVYTGRIYDAQEAFALGLLNHLVESEQLDEYVLQLAETVSRQSRASLQAVKKSVQLCEWRQDMSWNYVDPVDFPEGCLAFAQKREPRFM
jgi:enoyl-CoA hydratase